MKLTVYGPGCEKCKKLYENAAEAVRQSGVAVELEKVEGTADIAKAGVLFTPGLCLDGKLKATGKVVPVAKIVEWIKAAG